MRIVRLESENVKRLKAIDITPDPFVQIIGGNNGQGKTSLLDAIWLTLTGKDASKSIKKVIRDGEESAFARVTLGEDEKISYVVTRTWAKDGTSTLKLESGEGGKFASPQDLLNSMLGKLAFDPLAFTRLPPADQFDTLMGIVDIGVNLEALDIKADAIYSERTEAGREVKSLQAQVDAIELDPFAPEEGVNVGELAKQYQAESQASTYRLNLSTETTQLLNKINELQETLSKKLAELEELPYSDNLAKIKEQLDSAEETNTKVRAKQTHTALTARLISAQDEQASKTSALEEIATIKKDALANAKFPIAGLSVEEKTVTYNAIPFDQISESEKIKVSIAIGIALNPKIRVMRISDGSLLDENSLAFIGEVAHEKDFQLFLEVVGDKDELAILIEDGSVK